MKTIAWILAVLSGVFFLVATKFWKVESPCIVLSAVCFLLSWCSFSTSKDIG